LLLSQGVSPTGGSLECNGGDIATVVGDVEVLTCSKSERREHKAHEVRGGKHNGGWMLLKYVSLKMVPFKLKDESIQKEEGERN
jgi:hypothetical protein